MRWRAGAFAGKQLLNGLVHLPLILPPVVTGYLLLLAFGRQGPDRGSISTSGSGSCLPSAGPGRRLRPRVMAFPLMVRAIRLAIEAVDPKLEEAAGTLGASRLWVFATVTLAADPAGGHRRRDPGLRQGDGRVRCDDHLRLEHPRPDPDAALGDLRLPSGAGGRRAGAGGWCWSRSSWRWRRFSLSEWLGRAVARRISGDDASRVAIQHSFAGFTLDVDLRGAARGDGRCSGGPGRARRRS